MFIVSVQVCALIWHWWLPGRGFMCVVPGGRFLSLEVYEVYVNASKGWVAWAYRDVQLVSLLPASWCVR